MRKLTKEEKAALSYIREQSNKGYTVSFGKGNSKLPYTMIKTLHDLGHVRMYEYKPRIGIVLLK